MIFKNPNLICATSKRPQNMSLSYGNTKESLSNRKKFLNSLGIDYQSLVCAKQSHSDNVRYAQEADRGKGALTYETALSDTDALITNKKDLALAVFTADCLSIFLYDPKTSSIGLVHAGWRGSLKGVTAKTVSAMRERFKADPQNLYAGLGPLIRSCCYEVRGDFMGLFPDDLLLRDKRYYLDLISVNKKQLLGSGVREENISDRAICTSCRNKEYFSNRREGNAAGRMISVIMLK
ncbi:MAG: peptidoglycan editing factor PgeF [Candidatus Omnitrophica bacterium]|nr:peptidoglycan editing factor PgeF [Candidatus Omnitrophota bacterium]